MDNGQGDKIVERDVKKEFTNNALSSKEETDSQVLKFRVTRNRVEEKHCFTALETTRDFGGAVQDYFKWKADMTNFDMGVLLNIHDNEITVGIALIEESPPKKYHTFWICNSQIFSCLWDAPALFPSPY